MATRCVDEDLGELLVLVEEQLRMTPADRLQYLLGPGVWPGCRRALRAAAAVCERAVLVGPVAVALHGGPQQPGDGRVDLLCMPAAQDDVVHAVLALGAHVTQSWRARPDDRRSELRMHFSLDGGGELSVRARAAGVADVAAVVGAGERVDVDGSAVRVASLSDLIAVTFASPWGQDGPYRSGLRALRAWRDMTLA